MKKFTFKGVLDGFRSSVSQPVKVEPDFVESLKPELFQIARTVRHGFPHQPTALAYDPIQRLLAIGTKNGSLRILGRPGVSVHVRHEPLAEAAASASSAGGNSAATLPAYAGAAPGGSNPAGPQGISTGGGSSAGGGPGSAGPSGATSSVGATQAQTVNAAGNLGSYSASGTGAAVIQIQFLINEGALVTATADDSIHLWNIRQKRPEIVHSLKFQRERITFIHLPFQCKWLYVGTEKGNVHVVNIETFSVSGYVINWNKAIELSRKTHPGPVVHLSDCPTDSSKLLIGFESGLIVLWDLKNRSADCRFQGSDPLRSVAWLSDGKQFVSAHGNGSLATWNARPSTKPVPSIQFPHAKPGRDGKQDTCKSIQKVEWKSSQSGDPLIIFSGGLPQDRPGRSASITVMHGRSTTVLEMEHNVVDFVTLSESPWPSETQDPHSIIVLLQNDLVIVDLLTPGFPCFENPYPMDIHESTVTCCAYVADCPSDLIPALYSVGGHGARRLGFSERNWPVSGGEWGAMAPSYAEVLITGHADGTVKFWDTSSLTLQVLYRLKTSKVFDKSRSKTRSDSETSNTNKLLSIQHIALCADNRILAVAGNSGHVILFKFRRQEISAETKVLDVSLFFEGSDDPQYSPPPYAQTTMESELSFRKEHPNPLKIRAGSFRRNPGFQADLVCASNWADGQPPGLISSLAVNSAYGLMAYGNDAGLVVIDIIQKCVVLSIASSDLYSSADPYNRMPKSPKRPETSATRPEACDERSKSPTSEQTGVVEGVEALDLLKDSALPEENDTKETEEFSSTGSLTEDEKQPEVRKKNTWKNFNFRKKLVKADSKLRDLITAAGSRRGSQSLGSPTATQSTFYCSGAKAAEEASESETERRDSIPSEVAADPGVPPVRPPRSRKKPKSSAALSQPTSPTGNFKRWTSVEGSSLNFVDLRLDPEDPGQSSQQPGQQQSGFLDNLVRKRNKSDNSFTRSRSSSTSSLENQNSEAIATLAFADTLARKMDTALSASLWIGTSQGSLLVIVLNLPAPGESRLTQPVMISPSGTIFRLKGSVLCAAFLDSNGAVLASPSEPWRDEMKEARERSRTPTRPTAQNDVAAPSDAQFAVFVSEKHARVVALPSQICLYRGSIAVAENSFVVRADVITFKEGACLATYVSTGRIQVYGLPSLRPLLDIEFLPLIDLSFQTSKQNLVDPMLSIWAHQMFVNEETDQISRNFRFSAHGHGLYLCSPSEIEKFSISAEFVSSLGDLTGQLFLPCEMPEPPKEGFFKGLFGGGVRNFDREELFGESLSGKGCRSVAKHIPGNPSANLDNLGARSGTVAAEMQKARLALNERGDKLGQLEERTQRLMNEAENFSQAAHQLMVKCRDRKWYQL